MSNNNTHTFCFHSCRSIGAGDSIIFIFLFDIAVAVSSRDDALFGAEFSGRSSITRICSLLLSEEKKKCVARYDPIDIYRTYD